MRPSAVWLAYQKHRFVTWRYLGAGAAAINLLMAPLNFWFDYQLSLDPSVPRLQVQLFQATHAYAAVMASLFLVYYWLSRRRPEPRRGDYFLLSFMGLSVVGVATAIAAANQLSHGSVVVYAIACFFLMLVAFERPLTIVGGMSASVVVIIAASLAWQTNPVAAASAQLNTLLVGLSVSVIYPLYDAFRFRDYERQQRLERLIRLKDTLFRALGHDLRTPIVEVRRVARLLDDADTDVDPLRYTLAGDLDALTHRFGMVLNNLMALDAQTVAEPDGPRGPSAIGDCVEHVLALHEHDANRKSIALSATIPDDALLDVDRQTLIAVLDNLLSNAIKFTPRGGRVELAAEVGERAVRLAVSDNGGGFPEVFVERWRRGEAVAPATGTLGERGLGIGLGVVRSLLATLDSNLELERLEPRGARVSFFVPRYLPGAGRV
jgi:signal transduction histidine kinase